MLSKEEIIKKKAKSSQLDLVETIDEDKQDRKKRFWLYLSLVLTIGLSFLFWLYRTVSSVKFQPALPKFNFSLSLPRRTPAVFSDSAVTTLLPDSAWEVSFAVFPDLKYTYNWSKNKNQLSPESFQKIYHQLIAAKPQPDSKITTLIPRGLTVKETFIDQGKLELQSLVITPQKQILIIISTPNTDSGRFTRTINGLVPLVYWSAIRTE